MHYYNENDPKAAAWLRELIRRKLIPFGYVDTRSITEVRAADLVRYVQCHFFAGVGGWSLALRLAGWPEDRLVWTGSCPCQPFSAAGKQRGTEDERHLWPVFRDLIQQCNPPAVFGEQVASKLGRQWLHGVRTDLEALGYAVGAADLCAAGVGAPHIRQRLYWVADANRRQCDGISGGEGCVGNGAQAGRKQGNREPECRGASSRLELPHGSGRDQGRQAAAPMGYGSAVESAGGAGRMGDTDRATEERLGPERVSLESEQESGRSSHANPWANFELIGCADGKARRIEPGTFPLAHGVPGRVGLLRGYGNAIVPELAASFIQAFVEATA